MSLSYDRGATEPPLWEAAIGQALDEAAARWPDQDAVVCVEQEICWSYAELHRRAERVASALLGLGLEPGDRVGIWAPNCAEWALIQFATAKAGLILVNINPAYQTEELAFTLNKVGVKALATTSPFKTSDYVGMVRTLAPESLTDAPGALNASRLPLLRHLIFIGEGAPAGFLAFDDLYGLPGPPLPGGLANTDAINIQFTSGTTGLPKGATLTHRNILNNARNLAAGMNLRHGDRLCIPVPLYHCFGMVMGNLACLSAGAAMVYPGRGFDPLTTLKTLERERCTQVHGVPTMFIAELEHPDFARFNLSALRGGVMAGAPCPVAVMHKVMQRMHMSEVTIGYGMTETSPISFQSAIDDPVGKRVSTIGRVQPHLEIKLVDADGQTVARGQPGEICTRGYSVMLGYWDDAEKTAEAIDPEGWMHTGDLGVLDDDGYCNIVGRLKDMIIRGGENVYPREVEEFLFTHPKVEEVQVVGVPDPKFGEELCAWIRLAAGQSCDAEEITGFCRGRIAHYKIPRYVKFVDAFPMTVTGKIQKFQIREAMIEELGLRVEETA
jgi:fatty-acyl-CoA synthase